MYVIYISVQQRIKRYIIKLQNILNMVYFLQINLQQSPINLYANRVTINVTSKVRLINTIPLESIKSYKILH